MAILAGLRGYRRDHIPLIRDASRRMFVPLRKRHTAWRQRYDARSGVASNPAFLSPGPAADGRSRESDETRVCIERYAGSAFIRSPPSGRLSPTGRARLGHLRGPVDRAHERATRSGGFSHDQPLARRRGRAANRQGRWCRPWERGHRARDCMKSPITC